MSGHGRLPCCVCDAYTDMSQDNLRALDGIITDILLDTAGVPTDQVKWARECAGRVMASQFSSNFHHTKLMIDLVTHFFDNNVDVRWFCNPNKERRRLLVPISESNGHWFESITN